ncbi:uncharacterized protein LAESUDRAFT_750006 [Laetiporus sulphureus 93-53]|uniref:Uncharacterized protein n=1 Tax=Laetiporus sulphureus 93-53 TaxID=1314785 RepID=A0A165E964_9APHY|nr:uncharacterized protein LAESUDRAFT_750006 [Laetiporus sulphureus 93-53]KZT06508.1 hypothetical protein LAESUDRAFT_750006 [Laetiporus sulphureus 93-53]
MDETKFPPSLAEDVSSLTRRDTGKGRRSSESSTREVARLLIGQNRDIKTLTSQLETTIEQLKAETERADAAESRSSELVLRLKSAIDTKNASQQEAHRVKEELRLYKLQLENAQREIHKGQEIIDTLEAQRVEAEEAAARARSMAHKLREQTLIERAREEGRRQGLQEGLVQAGGAGLMEDGLDGYEQGTASSTRSGGQYEDEDLYSPLPTIREDRVSAPSTSSHASRSSRSSSIDERTSHPPAPPPEHVPARAQPPLPPKDGKIYPIAVHNTAPSPSHPPVNFPPDGWIPEIDKDKRIRLPPPHDLSPAPPTPMSTIRALEDGEDRPPLMLRPPGTGYTESIRSDSSSVDHHRKKSIDSQSTTMSQFELLGPPAAQAAQQPRTLSAITEERERASSMSPSVQGASSYLHGPPTSSSLFLAPDSQNIYARPPRSPFSSSSVSSHGPARASSMRGFSQNRTSNGSNISREYDITVESPSGPGSEQSSPPLTPSLLRAEDGPPSTVNTVNGVDHQPAAEEQFGMSMPPPSAPVLLQLDGQLPPGFQPIRAPLPPGSFFPPQDAQLGTRVHPQGLHSPSTGPPLPLSAYGGTPSAAGSTVLPGAFPASPEQVVIPHLVSPNAPAAPSATRYTRPAGRDDSSDSEETVSSRLSGSADTLTTPPARHRDLPGHGTPTYAIAPIPPNIVYPEPLSPRSTGSRGTAAGRIPQPPSAAGSVGSPGSTVTYLYAPTPHSRNNMALDAGRTPMNRPLSSLSGSARGTPGPEQSNYRASMRSNTAADALTRSNTVTNAGPPRPPSAAKTYTSSPTMSQASVAQSTGTSRSKKSKKAKGKSKIATVEEVADEG